MNKFILLVAAYLTIANIEVNCYSKYFEREPYLIQDRLNSFQDSDELADLLYLSNKQKNSYDKHDLDSFRQKLEALASEENENSLEEEDDVSNINDEKSNAEIKADPRDEESESHSSLGAGHQYMSGGAGEGKQHLQPDGSIPNTEEIKTDEDLPAYCDPPNPCPVGYKGEGEDCDLRTKFSDYTAEYSKNYQEQQNCMCDDDHNECHKLSKISKDKLLSVVAKKSPKIK